MITKLENIDFIKSAVREADDLGASVDTTQVFGDNLYVAIVKFDDGRYSRITYLSSTHYDICGAVEMSCDDLKKTCSFKYGKEPCADVSAIDIAKIMNVVWKDALKRLEAAAGGTN